MDEDGQNNEDLMRVSKAPIGPDGRVMNLHHLSQKDPGVLVLITNKLHTEFSGGLHFNSAAHYVNPTSIDRSAFEGFKRKFYPYFLSMLSVSSEEEEAESFLSTPLGIEEDSESEEEQEEEEEEETEEDSD